MQNALLCTGMLGRGLIKDFFQRQGKTWLHFRRTLKKDKIFSNKWMINHIKIGTNSEQF